METAEFYLHFLYIALMFSSAIVFGLVTIQSKKIPNYIGLIHIGVVVWSGLMYLTLLSGQSITTFNGEEVYLGRYLDWMISTPLMLLALSLTAFGRTKKSYSIIATILGLQFLTILSGFLAEIAPTVTYKNVWFTVGCITGGLVLYLIWTRLQEYAVDKALFTKLANFISVQWFIYPIAWLIGTPGLGLVGSFTTAVLFLLFPLISKAGFGFYDLWLLANSKSKSKK